jgi:hypothetical protein
MADMHFASPAACKNRGLQIKEKQRVLKAVTSANILLFRRHQQSIIKKLFLNLRHQRV